MSPEWPPDGGCTIMLLSVSQIVQRPVLKAPHQVIDMWDTRNTNASTTIFHANKLYAFSFLLWFDAYHNFNMFTTLTFFVLGMGSYQYIQSNQIQGYSWTASIEQLEKMMPPRIQQRRVCAHWNRLLHLHLCSPKSWHGTNLGGKRTWKIPSLHKQCQVCNLVPAISAKIENT